jgi:aquaglyceroporin related protein
VTSLPREETQFFKLLTSRFERRLQTYISCFLFWLTQVPLIVELVRNLPALVRRDLRAKMTSTSGPMSQGPPSLSHDWADDRSDPRLQGYTSNTPLTQAQTQQSAHSSELSPNRTSSSAQKTRSALGLHPQAPIDEDHDHGPRSELLWSRIRTVLREPFAEFWGVAIMVMFGDGSVAQVLLSTGQTTAPGGNGFGNYQSINWG